ncbi:MAG: MlaD family protein [Crocinitomicaceae bacterium]
MSKKLLFTFALVALLASCNNSTKVYFKTNDAKGIEIGDIVLIDSLEIGTVVDFGLTEDGAVIIHSNISSELPIPSNSKFKNSSYSSDGKRCIRVTLGSSETLIAENDTLPLKYSYNKIINDGKEKLIDKIKDKFGRKD